MAHPGSLSGLFHIKIKNIYNVDSGELTDIDAREIQVTGLPPLPRGMAAEGMDIIVRIRSAMA